MQADDCTFLDWYEAEGGSPTLPDGWRKLTPSRRKKLLRRLQRTGSVLRPTRYTAPAADDEIPF